jgi:hypothetical protein
MPGSIATERASFDRKRGADIQLLHGRMRPLIHWVFFPGISFGEFSSTQKCFNEVHVNLRPLRHIEVGLDREDLLL